MAMRHSTSTLAALASLPDTRIEVVLTKDAVMNVLQVVIVSSDLAAAAAHAADVKSAAFAPDKMETILYGVAYYPEYMPEERLEKDVALMQKAGINVVRMGESTWSSWEPRDGEFQFAWMERALNRLH